MHDSGPPAGESATTATLNGMAGDSEGAAGHAYKAAVMTTGPPAFDDVDVERDAIEMIADMLGGRIVAA